VQNIQVIDDYGDQANITGVKTGEPEKILNITIKPSKNYGYFGQASVGEGQDMIPACRMIKKLTVMWRRPTCLALAAAGR
jgi:hypothetical protein